jgi:hypothetical protein
VALSLHKQWCIPIEQIGVTGDNQFSVFTPIGLTQWASQVAEIADTEYFQRLKKKARDPRDQVEDSDK